MYLYAICLIAIARWMSLCEQNLDRRQQLIATLRGMGS
jgi:hypothetical protein